MQSPLDTQTYKSYTINLWPDEDATSPRNFDNAGSLVLSHRRFAFPNEVDFDFEDCNSWAEMAGILTAKHVKGGAILPVYMLDHSGVALRTGPFGDPWDSGQVGFILISGEAIVKEWGALNPETIAKATEIVQGEVETYSRYLNGECYGFTVTDPDGRDTDMNCWGFDDWDYAFMEAKASIDLAIKWQHKHRVGRVLVDLTDVRV